MVDRLWSVVWTLSIIFCLAVSGAQAQTAPSSASPNQDTAPPAGSPPAPQATAQPAKPPAPALNTADIVARANKSVGVDIQKRIGGWQQELSGIETNLQKPHLRYSDLNDFRDDLQRVRGEQKSAIILNQRSRLQRTSWGCLGRRPRLVNHPSRTTWRKRGLSGPTIWEC
jgi:potassium efflux system protein